MNGVSSRRTAYLLALLLLVTILAAVPAGATNWYGVTARTGCDSPNQAENREHTFIYESLAAETANAMGWVRVHRMNPTVVNTVLLAPSDYNTSVDVIVRDRFYDDYCGYYWYRPGRINTIIGLVTCDYRRVYGACDQHSLRVTNYYMDPVGDAERRSLMCHEGGHTLGLGHRLGGSCVSQNAITTNTYSAHDIGHLAGELP